MLEEELLGEYSSLAEEIRQMWLDEQWYGSGCDDLYLPQIIHPDLPSAPNNYDEDWYG